MGNFVENLYPPANIQKLAKKKGITLSVNSIYLDLVSVLANRKTGRSINGLDITEAHALDAGWEGRLLPTECPHFRDCKSKGPHYRHDPYHPYWRCLCYNPSTEKQKQAYEYGRKLRKILNPPSAFDSKGYRRFFFDGKGRVWMKSKLS